jgi:carbamoyl-phosphate synthase large subunit
MKSVGEAMGIGRTFTEAFLKAFGSRELEVGSPTPWPGVEDADLPDGLHPWFREQIAGAREALASGDVLRAKRAGWGDDAIGAAQGLRGDEVRRLRHEHGIRPVFRRVDSCGGEVEAASNYYYSTWGESEEALPVGGKERVVILGSGPNRIGQGIEFDTAVRRADLQASYEAVLGTRDGLDRRLSEIFKPRGESRRLRSGSRSSCDSRRRHATRAAHRGGCISGPYAAIDRGGS